MIVNRESWTLDHLRVHLQWAKDLELWTIPFYMSAMYSITDRASEAFQVLQSVVHQEMLHLQLVANVANAYGLALDFHHSLYSFSGPMVSHIDYSLDRPDPRERFQPYSTEIGPLDEERINAMCLFEYPEWDTGRDVDLRDQAQEYGSIGELYRALAYGASLLTDYIQGGVHQVDLFAAFYRNLPFSTVSASKVEGYQQVAFLLDVIREQGEGNSSPSHTLASTMMNTADDSQMELTHYQKFLRLKTNQGLIQTHPVKPSSDYSHADRVLQKILTDDFVSLQHALQRVFSGDSLDDFLTTMIKVGADIHNCWRNGVIPRFGGPAKSPHAWRFRQRRGQARGGSGC